jgi:hypothetical protein
MIKGGYYIKARCIQESDIAHCPPHFREIWDWLLMQANHKKKENGQRLDRGQVLTSYKAISDGLSWKVGYRIERYKKHEIQSAMKWLMKHTMVATTKTTRGMVVTILNYDKYQDQKNYETYNGNHNEHTMNLHDRQECKERKNNIYAKDAFKFQKKVPIPKDIFLTEKMEEYAAKKRWRLDPKTEFERFVSYHKAKGTKFQDWYAAFQKWIQNDIKWNPEHQKPEVEIV